MTACFTSARALSGQLRVESPARTVRQSGDTARSRASWLAAWLGLLMLCGGVELSAASPDQINGLIKQLGDPQFSQRQQATRQLADLGEAAMPALLEALKHPDPEIQRRARRTLGQLLELEHERRLQAFIDDAEGKQNHQLPGWERFQEMVGSDSAARQLFVQMQQAEAGLLASADAGVDPAAEALQLRLDEVMKPAKRAGDEKSSLGSLAALLFVSGDAKLDLPEDMLNGNELLKVTQMDPMRGGVDGGPLEKPLRKLLGQWILRPTGFRLLQSKLQRAVQLDLPEGLELGIRTLAQKELPANYRFYGVQAVAKQGGPKYAALLLPMLEDQGECTRRVIRRNEKIELISIQIRDVALAWLIHLTGQEHADYHLAHAKAAFERLSKPGDFNLSIISVYFNEEGDRDKALAKWQQWLLENPLPVPPALPESARAAALVAGSLVPDRFGVVRVPGGQPQLPDAPPADNQREAADRQVVRQLEQARQMIAERSYGEAALILGQIVADDQDYTFQPERLVPLRRGLQSAAEGLLATLPAAGREAYELQFESEARTRLNAALGAADAERLDQVGRHYLYTPAGREATYLLGAYYYDRRQPLRGALQLERIWEQPRDRQSFEPTLSLKLAACWLLAGNPERAEQVLVTLRDTRRLSTLPLGDRAVPFFEQAEDAVPWLEKLVGHDAVARGYQWPVVGGDAARNRHVADVQPYLIGEPLLRQTEQPELNALIETLQRQQLDRFSSLLPSGQPLVVDGTVFLRTATHLRAIQMATGEVRWESPLDDSLSHLLSAKSPDAVSKESFVSAGFERRLWDNPTFGALGSNGKMLFAVEGLAFGKRGEHQRLVVMRDGRRRLDPDGLKAYNTLAAYSLDEGKLVWETGGPQTRAERPLAGTLFLGPPLPLGDHLFVVGQRNQRCHLLQLDSRTGELVWQVALDDEPEEVLQLGSVPMSPTPDDLPSLRAGHCPSFADGVLVCPSENGQYVAIDLAVRKVLWSYESPPPPGPAGTAMMVVNPLQRQLYNMALRDADQRWADTRVMIADQRVLLTPDNSDQLLCLDLRGGTIVWRASRRDGMYVAGVTPDKLVVVVGRSGVWGLRLDNGKSAWKNPVVPLPAGSLPSGRGYLAERHYYVPLTTGEVAVIDVRQGRLVSRTRSPGGTVPGNLVFSGDGVLSYGPTGLWRFPTLEEQARQLAKRLEEAPDDAEALTQRGELSLYQGKVADALRDLRRALQLASLDSTRRLFIEAALEAIRGDFASYRDLARDVEPMLKTDEERLRFVKFLAQAYQDARDFPAALRQYIQLVELLQDEQQLEFVAAGHQVRNDRWLRSRIYELFAAASAEQQALLRERVMELESSLPPERFLRFFGRLPLGHALRLELAERYRKEKRWLEAECQLRNVAGTGPQDLRPVAAARLAELYRQAGRPREALRWYARIAAQWPDFECLPGVTGSQLTRQLPADDAVRLLADGGNAWPVGEVEVKTAAGSNRATAAFPLTLQFRDSDAPRLQFTLNTQGQGLTASDPWGDQQWEVALGKPSSNWSYSANMFSYAQGGLSGHLLAAWTGNRVVAVDTLASGGKLLWSLDTLTSQPPQPNMMQVAALRLRMPRVAQASTGNLSQSLAISDDCVCFVQDNRLVGVDPLDGSILWTRDGFVDGSDLLTDGLSLLVTAAGQTEARVLSVLDGRDVSACEVPSLDRRLSVLGALVAVWDQDASGSRLQMWHPLKSLVVWEHTFAEEARPAVMGGDELLVLEPDGKVTMLRLTDGAPRWKSQVPALGDLDETFGIRSDDRVLVVANTPLPANALPANQVMGMRVGPGIASVSGRVMALDIRDGKLVWSRSIPDQAFDLNQPTEIPVLTFLNQTRTIENNTAKSQSSLLCIDARDGRTLFEETSDGYNNAFNLTVKRADRQVEVASRRSTITLTFTDQPRAADDQKAKPAEAKPEESKPEESKPEESKPEESKPEEAKPADAKPMDVKPKDDIPRDAKSAEDAPAED